MKHQRLLRCIDEITRSSSIRKAAERLNMTGSALNRRLQDLELELGEKIFERLPRGVRLNAAGELLVGHIRNQIADLARVRSQIDDLSGFRRGTVSIACSQAMAHHILPIEVAAYRRNFPHVSFRVEVRDHRDALRALKEFEVDLALVFRPSAAADFQVLAVVEQRVMAVIAETHPLAQHKSVRLHDCAQYPLALPDASYGGRQILAEATGTRSFPFEPAIESNSFEFLRNYVLLEQAVTFQIELGAPISTGAGTGLVSRPVEPHDIRPGRLVFGKLRGRALTVASAKFADQLILRLESAALASSV